MQRIVLIIHNVRSCHNVGAMLRTAEGLGIDAVYLTGYSPYPHCENDTRLPHEYKKITKQINKTALDAEKYQTWYREESIESVVQRLSKLGFTVAALEQNEQAMPIHTFTPSQPTALIVGREVEGIEQGVIDICDLTLEIPMFGKKESYNVASAAAMALYQLKFAN